MRLKTIYVLPIILIILIGGILLSKSLDLWQTDSTKTPSLIKSGDFEGSYDPADIRGSYSFGDIETTFGIPLDVLVSAFAMTSDTPANIQAKDLEEHYSLISLDVEIGTGSLRDFVARYIGLPYESEEALPSTAVDLLREKGLWNEALDLEYEGRIIQVENSIDTFIDTKDSLIDTNSTENLSDASQTEEHDENTIGVKGNTTVADLINWGMSLESIEEIFGAEVSNINMSIQDICNQNDLSFGTIKTKLNTLLGVE